MVWRITEYIGALAGIIHLFAVLFTLKAENDIISFMLVQKVSTISSIR